MHDRPLSSADVAIKFAPKLNALSRMDGGILPIDLLLVESAQEAMELVKKMLETNQMRQQSQAAAEQDALVQAPAQLAQGFVWLYSQTYHKGVIGLVATRLAKTFQVPAFVGSVSDHGTIAGSARAPDGGAYNLPEILGAAQDVLTRFGGHAAAAGFEMPVAAAETFSERVAAFLAGHAKLETQPLFYDGVGDLTDFDDNFFKWFDQLEPFGAHFEAPQFLLHNIHASEVKTLKGGHLRLEIAQSGAAPRQAIWFSPQLAAGVLDALHAGFPFQVISQAGWNYFRGRKSFQLVIQDLRLSTSAN
jgi:single-stranded-DNA-specific exonuclease